MIDYDKIINFAKEKHKVHEFAAFDHVERIYNLCVLLASEYNNIDLESLKVAAYLHDISVPSKGPENHHKNVKTVIGNLLYDANFPSEKHDFVFEIIRTHTRYYDLNPSSIEAKILKDADGLDYIGAVGIMRGISRSLKNSEYNGNVTKDGFQILKNLIDTVEGTFYTKKAKIIAQSRIKYLNLFLEELSKEINNEDF